LKKIVAVIPARYESSRFPGKPLALIAGKTMIQRVYEQVQKVKLLDEVVVATDDNRIRREIEMHGGRVIMTGACKCGTERVYQAVQNIECDIVLNIQGDEPLIKGEMIQDLIRAITEEGVVMATLRKQITLKEEIDSPDIVKVVVDYEDNALYFSRCSIPYCRDIADRRKYYKHIGVYAYERAFLDKYMLMPEGFLENSEKLEQLRVLENGYKIKVWETIFDSIGVDIPEHIKRVEEELENER